MGRRKIEIKRIEDASVRAQTFSKHKHGVLKKAYELATLCGVQIAVIIFSLSGKPHIYGRPNVEEVVSRFQNECLSQPEECNQSKAPLQPKKKPKKSIVQMIQNSLGRQIDELTLPELMEVKDGWAEFGEKLAKQFTKLAENPTDEANSLDRNEICTDNNFDEN